MVFRYRGFRLVGTDPSARPVRLRIYDPMTREHWSRSSPVGGSFDCAAELACACIDGMYHGEACRIEQSLESVD